MLYASAVCNRRAMISAAPPPTTIPAAATPTTTRRRVRAAEDGIDDETRADDGESEAELDGGRGFDLNDLSGDGVHGPSP